jgi:hypothetical protein
MYIQSEPSGTPYPTQKPMIHCFSQPTTSQQIYPQNAVIDAGQSHDSIPLLNPVHIQPAGQRPSLNSENQWQKVSWKRYRNTDDQETQNAKKQEYWLGGTIPTTNRFSTF